MFEHRRIAISFFLLVVLLAGRVRAAELAFVVGTILEPEDVNEGDALSPGDVVRSGEDALVMVEHRWRSDIPSRDCILIAIFGYGQSYTVSEDETPGRCQTTVPTNLGSLQAGQPFLNRETRYGDAKFDEPTIPEVVAASEARWGEFDLWVRNARRRFTGDVISVSGSGIRLRSSSSSRRRSFSVNPSTLDSPALDTLMGQRVNLDYKMTAAGPEAVRIELMSGSSGTAVVGSAVTRPPAKVDLERAESWNKGEAPVRPRDSGEAPDQPAMKWTCTVDLHQGDTGTLQFVREAGKMEGIITVGNGSHRHAISGTWRGDHIQFWRSLSESSGQPFEGIAIQTRDGVVRMAGRFANRHSGVWSADCTPEQDQDPSAAPSSSDGVDVVLTSVGDNPIDVIKIVREVTGLGLRDAKDLVDSTPAKIQTGVSIEQARRLAEALESAGATVSIVARE